MKKEKQLEDKHDSKKSNDRGESPLDPLNLRRYLLDLTQALVHQEATIDRYNHLTVQSYQALGDLYLQIAEPRAVVMHRAAYRIKMILYGGHCHGKIRGNFRQALLRAGVPESKFSRIERSLEGSMRYEVAGDLLRRFGLKGPAAIEYHKAARVEEEAFGRENPDLAFLWRKIACLASIRKSTISGSDFDQMDRISGKWFRQQLKESHSSLHPKICSAVKVGDDFYKALLYSQAVVEYQKATTVEVNHHHRKDRRSRSRSQRGGCAQTISTKIENEGTQQNHSRRHMEHSTGDVMNELKTFLLTRPLTKPHHNEDIEHRKRSSKRSGSDDTLRQSSTTQEVAERKEENPVCQAPNPRSKHSTNADSITRSTTTIADSSRSGNMNSVMEEQFKEKPPTSESGKVLPSCKNLIISRSKMIKSQQSSSGTSMYQGRKLYVDSNDPCKPKSDSYLTKLAAKTSRIAKTTKRKLKRTLSSSSSLHRSTTNRDGKPSSESSLHSLPPSSEMRPKSESYAYLDSPPKTPGVSSIAEAKSKLQRLDFYASSGQQMNSSFVTESSEFTTPRVTNSESTSNSSKLIGHLAEHQKGGEQGGEVDDGNNSVMTSDKSIKETFISETAKMVQNLSVATSTTARQSKERPSSRYNSVQSLPPRISQASLLELVSHVQKMSSILQRQTFRLQHRLGDSPGGSEEELRNRDQAGSTKKKMPKGQKNLYQEIEQSFDECYSVLQRAFDRLDEDDLTNTQHGNEKSWALEEYRKTFTLEKAFVDQLRVGFESHLVYSQINLTSSSLPISTAVVDSDEVRQDHLMTPTDRSHEHVDKKSRDPMSSSRFNHPAHSIPRESTQTSVHTTIQNSADNRPSFEDEDIGDENDESSVTDRVTDEERTLSIVFEHVPSTLQQKSQRV